jgi:hypothetical protein
LPEFLNPFYGPAPDLELSVSESLALFLREPKAVCALED